MSGIPRAVDKKSWNSETIPTEKSGIPTPSIGYYTGLMETNSGIPRRFRQKSLEFQRPL